MTPTRLPYLLAPAALLASLSLAACGDDGGSKVTADAPVVLDLGFNKPTKSVHANMNDTDMGAADFSCLGKPTSDVAPTDAITINSTVVDFQDNTKKVVGATVVAFAGTDPTKTLGDPATPGADGAVSFVLPATPAHTRVGFKMTGGMAGNDTEVETYLMNQYFDPTAGSPQTLDQIQDVSSTTVGLLAGLIGVTRIDGTGEIAGAFRDCSKHEVSNFVAVFSSTSGTTTPITGGDLLLSDGTTHVSNGDAFYFTTGGTPLPQRHPKMAGDMYDAATGNGLFLVLGLPVTSTGYVQLWGYLTDADLAADKLTLLSELQAPILKNAVVTGSLEPVRQ